MSVIIDTDVAVHLRDRDPTIISRIAALPSTPFISVVTRVELEGGVYARADLMKTRRDGLLTLLAALPVIDFDAATADAYRRIVSGTGYSRAKILDRMIAATALVHSLTLVTINGDDFRDIPGLALDIWPAPGAQ